MKVEIECKAVAAGETPHGNTQPKLIPVGFLRSESFGSDGPPFCVHGEKLRWRCDWCEEHFAKIPTTG